MQRKNRVWVFGCKTAGEGGRVLFSFPHTVLLAARASAALGRDLFSMSFGGFGSTTPASSGFGGFGSTPASTPFGSASATGAAASPFGGGGSAFGAPSAFGSAANTSTAFGAPKPATGFGGFGANTGATSAFGAPASSGFGAPAATGGGMFGSNTGAATTGFGAANTGATSGFGSTGFGTGAATSAFGSTASPFGAKPAASASPFGTTSVFGGNTANQAAPSAFGSATTNTFGGFGAAAPAAAGTGMFGAANTGAASGGFGFGAAKSAFGAASTPFGGGATGATTGGFGGGFGAPAAAPSPLQVGTGNPPYQPTRDSEPTGTGIGNYISISKMAAYTHKSTEEFRYEDYLKRTNPAAAQAAAALNAPAGGMTAMGGGAFGATQSAFGGAAAPATPGFGAASGGFGTTTSTFGSTSSAFGAPTTPSAFGAANTGATSAFGGGFGSSATPAGTGGLFGNASRPMTGGFGAQTSSAFGAATTPGFGTATTAGTGGFGSAGGFGTSGGFGTTPAASTQGSSFGFGAPQPAAGATGAFGTSTFGKPAAASTGFNFGTTQPAAATSSGFTFGGGAQPAQTQSLFGGGAATAPGSSFSFNGGAPKTATSTGFGFGTQATTGGTSLFGGATSTGFGTSGGFGTSAPSAFGTSTGGSSLFGGGATATPATSTGGFGFNTTSTQATSGGMFGAKPVSGSLFGGSTATTGGSLFGGNTTGSSLFGGAATTGSTGTTGFGTTGFSSGGFGFNTAGATSATSAFGGLGSTGGSLFGQATQPAAPAQPQTLVAAPDVNPYGSGSFGAGLVDQNVKAALELQAAGGTSSSSRFSSFTNDIGLPRGPMDTPAANRRLLISGSHSIPVSFIRSSSFKGSKGRRVATINFSGKSLPSSSDHAPQEDDFKFSSSLFRNPTAKKLVIAKSDQSRGEAPARASVIPCLDEDNWTRNGLTGSVRNRVLSPDSELKYPVTFRYLSNKKSFTQRLHGKDTIKTAREKVKQMLLATSNRRSVGDIELVWKGRIVQDNVTVEELQLRDRDEIDVALVEGHEEEESAIEKDQTSQSTFQTLSETKAVSESAKNIKRFMSYDEFLATAIREEESGSELPLGTVSPACPTLKNEDYFTIPSYEELQRFSENELSQVEGFTVGCKGLGHVEWLGKTDVRHLALDELIFFEKKEVVVFKDDEHKHAHGTGLNKPAVVELLGVFPPRKSTSDDRYKDRVKQRTLDIGATFLDYSAATGIWRFRVEHFSRYGFDDDGDDEEGDTDMDKSGKADKSVAPRSRMATQESSFASGRPSNLYSNERAGLLRASAMYGGENGQATVTSFLTMPTGESKELSLVKTPEMDSFAIDESTPVKHIATSEIFPIVTKIPLKPLGIDVDTSSLPTTDKSATYQIMLASQQPQASVVHNQVDAGMFMARSFRCSWGPNGELVNIGKLVTQVSVDRSEDRMSRRVCIELPLALPESNKTQLKEGVALHYECCTADETRDQDFREGEDSSAGHMSPPEYALPSDNRIVDCLHKYVRFADAIQKRHPTVAFHRKSASLWKLVHALWGQEHDRCDTSPSEAGQYPLAARDDPREIEQMETFQMVDLRREAISQWFEDVLCDSKSSAFRSGAAPASQDAVLRLLCQHRIAEAAEMAMECGDFRLATLIAQAPTYEGSDFRNLLVNQLSQWSENATLEYVDEDLVLVYSLLAGSVEVLTSQKGQHFSWIVSLALFFWYKRGPATSLKTAMELYMGAVKKHLARAPESAFAAKKDDVLMEVMKLYVEDAVSLCSVLSPSGFMSGSSCHLDYELSWHLHSVLRAIGYKIERKWESHVHHNFIRQLESVGLWEEAAYVALNLSNAVERELTCRDVLVRHADVLVNDADKRSELCTRLRIPMEWIEEALAIQSIVRREHHEEIGHWMASHQYEQAHRCLVMHVAPACLFAGETELVKQLLIALEPMAAAWIPQWTHCARDGTIGGGLILEYLRLEDQEGLETGQEAKFLHRIQSFAQTLSSARSTWSNETKNTLVIKACVSSMIVSLATQAVQLQTLLSVAQTESLDEDIDDSDKSADSVPVELEPEFLSGLAQLTSGRETKFVESYRSTHLVNLCSTFIDWRA